MSLQHTNKPSAQNTHTALTAKRPKQASGSRKRVPLGAVSVNIKRNVSIQGSESRKQQKKRHGLIKHVSKGLHSQPVKQKSEICKKRVESSGTKRKLSNAAKDTPPSAPCSSTRQIPPLMHEASSPLGSLEDPMLRAKKLIVEAKLKSKMSAESDWLIAVDLYTKARDLLPIRLGHKLDRKIKHLQDRIHAAKSPSHLEESIKRAKFLIVQAKLLSKDEDHSEWSKAIGFYTEARDLLPPHLGNKLTRKISTLQTRIAAKVDDLKRKKISTPVQDPLDDLLSDDLGDFFAEFRPSEKVEAKTPVLVKSAADWLSEDEAETECLAVSETTAAMASRAPSPLVFDRFGSIAAEVFALALGRTNVELNTDTPFADELLGILRAIDSCETEILSSDNHALKTSWRHLAKRKKKRVHFCTFDLSTAAPPEKWCDVSNRSSDNQYSTTQEALAHKLGLLLDAAKTYRSCLNSDGKTALALEAFLKGLHEVSSDMSLSLILRKAATFFCKELKCLLEEGNSLPFGDQFRCSVMSAVRFHMRCLFNAKPDSITTRICSDMPTADDSTHNSNLSEIAALNAKDDSYASQLKLDSEGSIKFCGNDDIAAIIHQALRDRSRVCSNELGKISSLKNDFSGIDDRWLYLEASRFLYEVLTHPNVCDSYIDNNRSAVWQSLSCLGSLLTRFPDVCKSEQCLVDLALNPSELASKLKNEVMTSNYPTRLQHVDSCLLSRAVAELFELSEETHKGVRRGSKRKCKKTCKISFKKIQSKLSSINSKYIMYTSMKRFCYPTLNCR